MLIAALDSTAVTASACIAEINDGVLKTYSLCTVKNKLTHSELLLPLLENACNAYGASIKDVDLFAVSAGPGSFTGVRIGASTVKGLAFAQNKPCAAVSALEALAACQSGGYVLPVMDARRDQFYVALFKDGVRVSEDAALTVPEIIELTKDLLGVTVCGDGMAHFIELAGDPRFSPASPVSADQNALSVALIGYKAHQSGEVTDGKSLQPTYLRLPQAERERLEREGR